MIWESWDWRSITGSFQSHFTFFRYSYASVSLTVSLEALLAGSALAIVANTNVKINQAMTPVTPYTFGRGAVAIAMPTPKVNTPVIGNANKMLISQLMIPITMPSTMTMP